MSGAGIFVDAAARPSLYRSRSMNGAPSSRTVRKSIARDLGVMALIGLALGFAGPFGMFAEPLWRRMLEWMVFAIGGYLFFRPAIAAGRALATDASFPHVLATAAACALAALPTSLLVALTMAGWHFPLLSVGALLGFYPQVLLVGVGVTAIFTLLFLARREAPPIVVAPVDSVPDALLASDPPASPPRDPGAAFLDRLPPAIGRDLLCLENEDHYIRAHTPLGSGLLLMRLRDAAVELESVEGLRVHRGWWVARAAVAEFVRRDRALSLRLVNGLEVPVARTSVPLLREAGWL